MLGAEELLRAVDRELLYLVDDLTAAVVALARISLGVLVRRRRPDCLEHRRPGEVLRGDQLDLAALALGLAPEELGDLGVDLLQARGGQLLERLLRGDGHQLDRTAACSRRRTSALETAPSRRTRGSGPVRSTTVEGVPGSAPPSITAAAPSRISSGTSARRRGSGSPGRFALVATTAPSSCRTDWTAPVSSGTRTPSVVGVDPVTHGNRCAGFATTTVSAPGNRRRACSGSSGKRATSRSTSAATSAVGCVAALPFSAYSRCVDSGWCGSAARPYTVSNGSTTGAPARSASTTAVTFAAAPRRRAACRRGPA